MNINTKELTNETLLVLFKKLNKQGQDYFSGKDATLKSKQFEVYLKLKEELNNRMDKEQLHQWEYKLYPKHMSYSGIDMKLIEEILKGE